MTEDGVRGGENGARGKKKSQGILVVGATSMALIVRVHWRRPDLVKVDANRQACRVAVLLSPEHWVFVTGPCSTLLGKRDLCSPMAVSVRRRRVAQS